MLDPATGNIVADHDKIKETALLTYSKRLENKPIKNNLESIKVAKEILCDKLLEVAAQNKTPPWKLKDLEKALKYLKKDKSRDPYGYCNELFQHDVAGDDLQLALLKLMNRIKEDQVFPRCMELCNISSIWKGKSSRNDYDSYRGIFRVNIFRSILDRLIYNDEYATLDSNLTDCNVGARKQRNIRDNIFVMNAIMNSIRNNKEQAIDCQVYDVEKCFDNLWLKEVINCLYEAGLDNDKLPLLFIENQNAQVAVKTPVGMSRRANIQNLIMQGSVWGSICCVVLMDKLGKLVYKNPEYLYYYKGLVATPPLQMVDDILGIQKCSRKSQRINGVINTFIEVEKLTLSSKRCHNVHIGKKKNSCHKLKVHEAQMRESSQQTYLGDKVDSSALLKPTLVARVGKGYGAVTTILSIVNDLPLGHWRVQAELRLWEALFINRILFNSEAWQGIAKDDIESLEKVDEALIRGILGAHAKIPKEALFLETGTIPLRYIIKSRRMSYLKTILDRDSDELIREVYDAQKVDPTPGDFADLVAKDAEEIKVDIQDENAIIAMKTKHYKTNIKTKVREAGFKYLKQLKINHSKLENLHYEKLELAQYLRSPLFDPKSVRTLLALRTRTVRNVRNDFRGLYPDISCPLGCPHPDTIPNILTCSVIQSEIQTQDAAEGLVIYEDIFSNDIVKQKQVTALYMKCIDIRENIINSKPVATRAGPMH